MLKGDILLTKIFSTFNMSVFSAQYITAFTPACQPCLLQGVTDLRHERAYLMADCTRRCFSVYIKLKAPCTNVQGALL